MFFLIRIVDLDYPNNTEYRYVCSEEIDKLGRIAERLHALRIFVYDELSGTLTISPLFGLPDGRIITIDGPLEYFS